MQPNTKKLLIALAALVIFVYLRFYMSVSSNVKITQLSLTELSHSILMEKNPIIIEERIVNPISLLQTVFKYMYVYKRVKEVEDGDGLKFRQNRARFMILSSKIDDCSVQIQNPNVSVEDTASPPYVDVRLHANMTMILPYKWWYRLPTPQYVSSIALEDVLSLTLGRAVL